MFVFICFIGLLIDTFHFSTCCMCINCNCKNGKTREKRLYVSLEGWIKYEKSQSFMNVGHSTTTWTNFDHLPPSSGQLCIFYIHTTYNLPFKWPSVNFLLTTHLPLLFHVVIEWLLVVSEQLPLSKLQNRKLKISSDILPS